MYVFVLLTWSRSSWEPPKFTFKSFFCMPDAAFEVVCPSPQGSRSPGPRPVAPLCAPPPITGSVSESGGHGVGGAGPQGSVPPNGKSSDVSSVYVSGAQAGQMSPWPPSLNIPFLSAPLAFRCSTRHRSRPFQSTGHRKSHLKCLAWRVFLYRSFFPFSFHLFSAFFFSACFFFLIYCCILLFLNQDILSHQTL